VASFIGVDLRLMEIEGLYILVTVLQPLMRASIVAAMRPGSSEKRVDVLGDVA
jgi:hypothetical protein